MGLHERQTYRAKLIPVWDSWVVEVPDAGGVHCLVLARADAERTARDAIATMLDVDARTIDVLVESE